MQWHHWNTVKPGYNEFDGTREFFYNQKLLVTKVTFVVKIIIKLYILLDDVTIHALNREAFSVVDKGIITEYSRLRQRAQQNQNLVESCR